MWGISFLYRKQITIILFSTIYFSYFTQWNMFLPAPSSTVYPIILSCHGTLPTSELTKCLMRFLCAFASFVSLLFPCPCTWMSLICLDCLHVPGAMLWFSSSVSTNRFYIVGYRVLLRLWRHMQVLTMRRMVSGWCCIVDIRTWKCFAIIHSQQPSWPWKACSWIFFVRHPVHRNHKVSSCEASDKRHRLLQREKQAKTYH